MAALVVGVRRIQHLKRHEPEEAILRLQFRSANRSMQVRAGASRAG
jgi:hypothetical protein